MATRIQVRRGTTSEWNTANPTLEEGEIGYNSTLGQIKVGDGSTSWGNLDYVVNSAALDTSLGSYIPDSEKSAINGVAELDASKNILAPAGIIFEGTADAYETTLVVTDPTADRTITFPNSTGTVALTTDLSSYATLANPTFTGTVNAAALTLSGDLTVNGTTTTVNSTTVNVTNAFIFEGTTADPFETTLTVTDPTADRTITLPDSTGTVALTSDLSSFITASSTDTLTNKTLTSPKINENVVLTATATELNYVDGVTSAIQTQLDGKVDESLFDAKGDILVASADNTPAKLGVGTNGYILTANSGATNGVEWAAAPISLPSQTGESGKYLTTDGTTASWGTVSSYSAPTIGSTSIASGATVTTISGLTLSSPAVTTSLTLNATAELRLADTDSTHYVGFKAPGTVTTNKIWTLPSADGTNGQTLSTNGSGTLSWSTAAAGAAFSEFLLIGC
jgi:hypothetical protein